MTTPPYLRPLAAALTGSLALAAAGAAHAQAVTRDEFNEMHDELARQAKVIKAQAEEIAALRAPRPEPVGGSRTGGGVVTSSGQTSPDAPLVTPVTDVAPRAPVGQAPVIVKEEVAAIPQGMGVLTPRGRFVVDSSIEYDRTSNNRLVFRGVEIVPGVQLGVIEASDAARDTGVATVAARYGLTDRLEIEARVPYVWRQDRITTLAQRDDTLTRASKLNGMDIGDIEFDGRYQINSGRNGMPVFVATARVKPPTGRGPFDVDYDANGVATNLATGSGFWGAESGITMLYPTDPAIIFGGLTYLHNFSRDIDKTIGGALVGHVTPGDSIGATLGFGLSVNPRLSLSFGYSHAYIFPTDTVLGGIKQSSQPLQVGSLLMGWSFQLNDKITLNNSFQFGVTSDAPDLQIVFRVPYRF